METIEDFYTETTSIVRLFDAFAEKHSLRGRAAPDHICYKCGSRESFERIRTFLEPESEYLFQSIISKRPIAIVRLKRGIETVLGTIFYLELSDQKPDNSQQEGFDHIEVYAVGRSYDDMVRELEATESVKKIERPHHITHDIDMGEGMVFRCTQGPLIEKIKREEMR